MIKKYNELTPVQNINGLYLKREDLFMPFGNRTVNGGKLRQCLLLVNEIKEKYNGVISCCSIYSPQAPITAAVAKNFNLPCIICYGATNKNNLMNLLMPRISLNYGAKLKIISKSGIHKILYTKAKKIAEKLNLFVVDYGFNISEYPDLLFNAISFQVQNLPENLENLVVTCGSGITTIGILLGINKYKKNIKNIHLVGTAPNREKFILETLKKNNCNIKFQYHDLFKSKKFKYEDEVNVDFCGIKLHPNYEAKTFLWAKKNLDITNNSTCLWIVGSKPIT